MIVWFEFRQGRGRKRTSPSHRKWGRARVAQMEGQEEVQMVSERSVEQKPGNPGCSNPCSSACGWWIWCHRCPGRQWTTTSSAVNLQPWPVCHCYWAAACPHSPRASCFLTNPATETLRGADRLLNGSSALLKTEPLCLRSSNFPCL